MRVGKYSGENNLEERERERERGREREEKKMSHGQSHREKIYILSAYIKKHTHKLIIRH